MGSPPNHQTAHDRPLDPCFSDDACVPMPGREKEYAAYQEQVAADAEARAQAAASGVAFGSAPRPAIDEERKARSPGLSRNFYDTSLADFKRPHGVRGPLPNETPPPPAAAATGAGAGAPVQPTAYNQPSEEMPLPGGTLWKPAQPPDSP